MRMRFWLCIVALFLGVSITVVSYIVAQKTTESLVQKKKEEEEKKKKQQAQGPKENSDVTIQTDKQIEAPVHGKVLAFIVLLGAVLAIARSAYMERRGTAVSINWAGENGVLLHPVFITIVALVVLDALMYLFAYPLWVWLTKSFLFFSSLNLAILALVHFATKKGTPARVAAWAIGLLILLGFWLRSDSRPSTFFTSSSTTASSDKSVVVITAPAAGVGDSWSKALQIPQGFSIDPRSLGHRQKNNTGEIVEFDPSKPTCFENKPDSNPCMKSNSAWIQFQAKGVQPVGVTVKFLPYRPVPR
ncbi:MAG: hypothetical protein AAB861_01285 [Patescibacteria group bacterium]